MARSTSQEVKNLHKKLIPGNIVMAVVGFVAALCSLFMPWLDVRVNVNAKQLATTISQPTAQIRDDNGITLLSSSTETDDSEDDLVNRILSEAISSLPNETISIPINVYPMKLYAAATGSEREVAEFIVSTVGKDGIVEEMNKIVRDIIPSVMNASIIVIVEQTVEDIMAEENLPEEDRNIVRSIMDAHLDEAVNIVVTLVGTSDVPSKPEQAKQDLVVFLDNLERDEQLNVFFEEGLQIPKDECVDIFNSLVDAGTENGVFDVFTLIKNFDQIDFDVDADDFVGDDENDENSQGGNGNLDVLPDESGNDKEEVGDNDAAEDRKDEYGKLDSTTKNIKVICSTMNAETELPPDESVPDEGESDGVTAIFDILQDPTTALTNLLLDSGVDLYQIQPILLLVFVVLMGIPAALWLFFAIMAIVHIFTEDKKTATWYVKIFGFTSALVICILNLLPKLILSLAGDAVSAETLSAISIQFLGSGLVVAICWAVLVLLGFCYYNPIKRKIKKALREEKYALANDGYPTPVSNLPPQSFTPIMPTETDEDEYLDEEVDEPIVTTKTAEHYKPDVSAYTQESETTEETENAPCEETLDEMDSTDEVEEDETLDEE